MLASVTSRVATVRGRWARVSIALAIALGAHSAAAQDDQTRATARELAQRASEAYEAGDFHTAQDLFHRAYTLVAAPTLSLREARALVKLSRLVEALEAYARTTRTKLDESATQPFRDAVDTAAKELEELRPRVPLLKILVSGNVHREQVSVTLDGKPVNSALIGVASPVNPGSHALIATAPGGAQASGSVDINEGETKQVTLKISQSGGSVSTATTASTSASGDQTRAGSSTKVLAYVALGVGVVGAGTGVATGLMATSRHSKLESECPNQVCPAGSQGEKDLDAFRNLRTISTIGYVVGAVGVGAGITLLVLSPSQKPSELHVSAYLGPNSLGLKGVF
jgi:hypothetical protein